MIRSMSEIFKSQIFLKYKAVFLCGTEIKILASRNNFLNVWYAELSAEQRTSLLRILRSKSQYSVKFQTKYGSELQIKVQYDELLPDIGPNF